MMRDKISRIIKATLFTILCVAAIAFLIYATVHCFIIQEYVAAVLFILSDCLCGFLTFCWCVDYWRK